MTKQAIVLLSGGLDSSVTLAQAIKNKRKCLCIAFDYGQRNRLELRCAKSIARYYAIELNIIRIDPAAFAPSALLTGVDLMKNRTLESIQTAGPPTTTVAGRNTLFLSYAFSQAIKYQAAEIYFGANALDTNPYPDCRPKYIKTFEKLINLASDRPGLKIVTPLIHLNKTEILTLSQKLKVPIELTLSCYDPGAKGEHCGLCDACVLRKKGFIESQISDSTIYKN